jgi:PIN domain nuclease of toxin-antitoxin system
MKLLPDSHVLIWWLEDSPRLSVHARALLEDDDNPLLFSAAAAWEIGMKQALGKLRFAESFDILVEEVGCTMLAIDHEHAEAAAALPLHHRDPFDRMLVAQAQIEDAVLISADPALRAYDVRIEW